MKLSNNKQEKGRNRKGIVALEFAIAAPLLIVMTLGLFQLGYAFLMYNELRNAVMDGARYASISDYLPGSTQMADAATNVVLYGTPTVPVSGSTLVYGLTADKVSVSVAEFDGSGIPLYVDVSISGVDLGALWPMTLTGKPKMSMRYMGQYVGE